MTQNLINSHAATVHLINNAHTSKHSVDSATVGVSSLVSDNKSDSEVSKSRKDTSKTSLKSTGNLAANENHSSIESVSEPSQSNRNEPIDKAERRNTSKKLRVNQELDNATHAVVSKGTEEGPVLFKQWQTNPLSLLMFDNAPILMMLMMEVRKNMAEAQKTIAKAQIDTAWASAEMKKEQGLHEQAKCNNQAAQGLVSGSFGILQSGASFKDMLLEKDVFQNQLDHQNEVVEYMSEAQGPAAQLQLGGGVDFPHEGVSPSRPTGYSVPFNTEKAIAKELATAIDNRSDEIFRNLKETQAQRGDDPSLSKGSWFGLNKSASVRGQENQIALKKQANEMATEQVFNEFKTEGTIDGRNMDVSSEHRDAFIGAVATDPALAKEFILALGHDTNSRLEVLRAASFGTEIQIKDSNGQSIKIAVNLKAELLRSFSKSSGGPGGTNAAGIPETRTYAEIFKAETGDIIRTKTAPAAESNRIEQQRKESIRRELVQLINGFAQGGTGISSGVETVKAAENDAMSQELQALASNFAAVRGALGEINSKAVQDIDALFKFYDSASQSVTQANTSAMA